MCAINGFTFANLRLIRSMNQLISYRGPDDGGEYVNSHVSLGNRRLSILDLSTNGHMPMGTHDGRYWITYNGEIYNHQLLKRNLRSHGYKFRSSTDTEVILNGFAHLGPKFINKLNGMFAFAIWDNHTHTLTLARDRVGIKPLYYAIHNNQLIFSSEIKALLLHPLSRDIDPEALNLYFRLLYVPSPWTIYQHIKKLPPASILTFHLGAYSINKYWHPHHPNKSLKAQQIIPTLRATISRSVKRQLVSDRPIGIFLSGGLDSSLVLAFAAKYHHQPINTYTVGFKVDQQWEKYNQDLVNARLTSNFFHTNHHELIVTADDLVTNFDQIIYHLDEPISNPTQIASFNLSQLASQDIKVALTGDGGDELFAGYPRYQHLYFLRMYHHLPLLVRNLTPKVLKHYSLRLQELALKANVVKSAHVQSLLMSQSEDFISQLLNPHINQPYAADKFFNHILINRLTDDINNFTLTDFMTWLPEESLIKSDKLTMAHGLEQRQPLLGNHVLDLAISIPLWQKISMFTSKKIIRDLSRDLLPSQIVTAPKWGFFSPVSKWLRTQLKDYAYDALNSDHLDQFINVKFAKSLMDRHCQGEYFPHSIWGVVTFARWYQTFIAH